MQVTLHNRFRQAQRLAATSVVVEDEFGNVCAVVLEQRGGLCVLRPQDPEWEDLLQELGLRQSIILTLPEQPGVPGVSMR